MKRTNEYFEKDSIILTKEANDALRPYAVPHQNMQKAEETHRTKFRRHRDRILYTGGFRRMQDKTQVISATRNGDHRTRLTHTLEVEQMATSIADSLGLNRDLTSAIAYGHDIGHTPFGHSGERTLNELLKDQGGFSHSIQSVKYLMSKYKKDDISDEIYDGILKHDTDFFSNSNNKSIPFIENLNPDKISSLEAQVVYWSDKLAYLSHDLEDYLKNNFYKNTKEHDIKEEKKLKIILAKITNNENILKDISFFETRDIIRLYNSDLIEQSIKNINKICEKVKFTIDSDYFINESSSIFKNKYKDEECNINNILNQDELTEEEIKKIKSKNKKKLIKKAFRQSLTINLSKDKSSLYDELRDFLDINYIQSPQISLSDAKAKKIITSIFNELSENINLLPLNIRQKLKNKIDEISNRNTLLTTSIIENINLEIKIDNTKKDIEIKKIIKENIIKRITKRKIADYISSMSDSYAEDLYRNYNLPNNTYNY